MATTFAALGDLGWGVAAFVVGVATASSLMFWRAAVPVTPLQLIWLAAGALVAWQFASTGVGAEAGFVVWIVDYASWLFYRAGARARERGGAALTSASIVQADPASWPVLVDHGRGRTFAFRIAFAFFTLTFLSSTWLLVTERPSSTEGFWAAVSIAHLAVLGALLRSASRAAERITLYPDRIEVARMLGRRDSVTWANVVEARIVRWVPQGVQPPQLRLIDASGRTTVALDLGDARQRSLLPYVRRRLAYVSWQSERRTSWL